MTVFNVIKKIFFSWASVVMGILGGIAKAFLSVAENIGKFVGLNVKGITKMKDSITDFQNVLRKEAGKPIIPKVKVDKKSIKKAGSSILGAINKSLTQPIKAVDASKKAKASTKPMKKVFKSPLKIPVQPVIKKPKIPELKQQITDRQKKPILFGATPKVRREIREERRREEALLTIRDETGKADLKETDKMNLIEFNLVNSGGL